MAKLEKLYIMFGLPTWGIVSMRWACAFRHLQLPMNCKFTELAAEGAPVDEARNWIVANTLRDPSISHVMFIDDDVLVHGQCLLQLLSAKKDIGGGVYFAKGPFGEPIMYKEPSEGAMEYIPGSGLHRVWGCGMGLTLIRTAVFRRMRDELNLGVDSNGLPRWFYTSGDRPGEILRTTEDLWFCRHADKLGIECYVDMSPYAFGWHWDRTDGHAWPQPQWDQHAAGQDLVWDLSDEAIERLNRAAG